MSIRKNWAIIILTFFLAFSVATSYAQDAENNTNDPNDPNSPTQENTQEINLRIDGNQIKSYIEWLARDNMQGRQSLTDGYRKAADWAAENFRNWGLKPAGENGTYFQDVSIKRGFTYMTGMPELRIANHTFLMEEEDFSVHPKATAATRINADIVFVGYGISAPDKGLDEYADMEVEGKIVLAFTGSPKDAQPPRGRFAPTPTDDEASNEPWEKESTERAKIQTAYDKGAAAILLFNPDPPPERDSERRFMPNRRPGDNEDEEPELEFERDFLIFTIEPRIFHVIMKPDKQESIRGLNRRIETIRWDIRKKQSRSMATDIKAQLKGYDNVEEYSEELENNIARNVLAKIEGTDPNLKDQYVILGGHMDHLGVRNGLVYNGADDNASGTAVVLEIARLLSQSDFKPKRTIIFCCWCGEELGLLGSNHYTENPCDGVTMDKVVAYFNMDMVGLGDKIGAPGALNFPTIWEVIKKNQDEDVISVIEPETAGPGGSDYSGFITKGIEALALMTSGGGGHPDYHRPEDDADKMDPEILRKTGQFVLQGTINLANDTKTNLLIENRLWIYQGMRLSIANINPELEDSDWTCIDIDGYSQDKLRWRIASVEDKPQKRLEVGIPDLKIFEGDVELLIAASNALGFGRADIKGSDGQWIVKGQLTEHGRYALGMMEENRIAVNLVNPSPQLLRDVLANANKPFIVTGFYILDPQTYEQINKKNVILSVKFDPEDVDGCIERLEKIKAALGDTDNLVLYVTSKEKMDEGKKDLYMRLMESGWKSEEIGSAGRRRRWGPGPTGSGIAGGNLSVLRSPR